MALPNGFASLLHLHPLPNPIQSSPAKSLPIQCTHSLILHPLSPNRKNTFLRRRLVRATSTPQKYHYPDPIPEFAQSETEKFRTELYKKLYKDKETFGGELDRVVDVCSEIFSDFLHKDYGGPGTLLVEPFTDMLVALKELKLPGAPLAARAALLWAQTYVDQDWETWNSEPSN